MPIPNKTLKELARGKQDLAEKARPAPPSARKRPEFDAGKSAFQRGNRQVAPRAGLFRQSINLRQKDTEKSALSGIARRRACCFATTSGRRWSPDGVARSISRLNFFPVSNLSAFLQVAARNGP
ncbi:MAG: hypothetical protein ACM3WS_03520 [Bacillota bacterium]